MKEELEQLLERLKEQKIGLSKIESDLGFSNGLLGKVKNGKTNLSNEKVELVFAYYKKVMGFDFEKSIAVKPEIEETPKETILSPVLPIEPEIKAEVPEKPIQAPQPAKEPQKQVVLPKASGIMLGSEYLASLPKTEFQKLLIEFNELINDQPPVKQVEEQLYQLILKSENNPNLNGRQAEAIRDRCINYLTGQYGKSKPKN